MTYRFFWGYPETRCPYSMIGKGEAAFLDAAAETLFPPGAGMPISGGQADLPGYAEAYLSELPRTQRRLIRALFFLFEQSPLLWPARGVGAFRRFSFLSPEQRLYVLQGWEQSRWPLRRLAFVALKAVLILGYVGHKESLTSLDLLPWSMESPIREADLLYPAIGASRDSIAYTRADLTPLGLDRPLRSPSEGGGA